MRVMPKDGRSEIHSSLMLGALDPGAKLLFSGIAAEARGHAQVWIEAADQTPERCIAVIAQREREIDISLQSGMTTLPLTDVAALSDLLGTGMIYLDVTGMSHHVWAPILKVALHNCSAVRIVYFEPEEYKEHPTPSSTSQFDLSSGFRGVEPLPGFANLMGPPTDSKALFVPFLGFEGPRARQVAMTLDPIPPTIPIVGLPGFRIEYPQVTIASNQEFLVENFAGPKVRYANASCPFEAFSALVEIRRDHPGSYLYVAPLGTKPHAVGAVWFALENPHDTELMYDHPIRTAGRTSGVGAAHIYHLKS